MKKIILSIFLLMFSTSCMEQDLLIELECITTLLDLLENSHEVQIAQESWEVDTYIQHLVEAEWITNLFNDNP